MSEFREYEKQILRLLIGSEVDPGLLATICSDELPTTCEHTGVGYFVTVFHPDLPSERKVLDRPFVCGKFAACECGFLAFLGGNKLTLECHGWGNEVPKDVRDSVPTLAVTVNAEV